MQREEVRKWILEEKKVTNMELSLIFWYFFTLGKTSVVSYKNC